MGANELPLAAILNQTPSRRRRARKASQLNIPQPTTQQPAAENLPPKRTKYPETHDPSFSNGKSISWISMHVLGGFVCLPARAGPPGIDEAVRVSGFTTVMGEV